MTIKEVAQRTGLTHQAIYKRLKAHGVKLETLKDKVTGQFTPEGEAVIAELFGVEAREEAREATRETARETAQKPVEKTDATEVEKLRNQVAELTTEVEKLRNQVATLESERDFLRVTLEREQQLHGLTIAKLPTPPAALPPADQEKGRLRSWWDKVRGRA